ncbi:hypothetical protein HY489_02325 [Candidatus Woesearchaeota archaeon]|nr:hypothetical protein [Candidatus Woesearchaeota archaeon]
MQRYEINLRKRTATIVGRVDQDMNPLELKLKLSDLKPVGNPVSITARDDVDFYTQAIPAIPPDANAFHRTKKGGVWAMLSTFFDGESTYDVSFYRLNQ